MLLQLARAAPLASARAHAHNAHCSPACANPRAGMQIERAEQERVPRSAADMATEAARLAELFPENAHHPLFP